MDITMDFAWTLKSGLKVVKKNLHYKKKKKKNNDQGTGESYL